MQDQAAHRQKSGNIYRDRNERKGHRYFFRSINLRAAGNIHTVAGNHQQNSGHHQRKACGNSVDQPNYLFRHNFASKGQTIKRSITEKIKNVKRSFLEFLIQKAPLFLSAAFFGKRRKPLFCLICISGKTKNKKTDENLKNGEFY